MISRELELGESLDLVLGDIDGESAMVAFVSEEDAAHWALYAGQKRRLWSVKAVVISELEAVPPSKPRLRVKPVMRTEPVDVSTISDGAHVNRIPGRQWTEE